MKTTAFILGVLSLFAFASCRFNIDEEENKKRDQKNNQPSAGRTGLSEK
ncbi:hypothetical protein [Chryseobacterium joostei]|nr:hypothetical protein [Chryseobacterium joostei]